MAEEQNNKIEEIKATDFSQEEVKNINHYITTQIPHTILPRLFVLTEDINEKCSVYLNIYALIESTMYYVKNQETRDKIRKLLEETKDAYKKLYKLSLEKHNSEVSIGRSQINTNIANLLTENSRGINKLRSIFLVFAERIELTELDKVTGLDTSTQSGKNLQVKLGDSLKQ